ncbi:hypothetical protein BHE74_00032651 [Ensete ventricosum]|nr:hypothetical protein BHE74_00032651 [Ensete ventricosum]
MSVCFLPIKGCGGVVGDKAMGKTTALSFWHDEPDRVKPVGVELKGACCGPRNHCKRGGGQQRREGITAGLWSLLTPTPTHTDESFACDRKLLIVALVHLLDAFDVSIRFIKDALKMFFGLALYSLNRTSLIDLGTVLPLFTLVVKDEQMGLVEVAMMVIA